MASIEFSYAGENIKWTPCGEVAPGPFECSRIDVPMDQFNSNTSDKTFSIPLIRLRGKNAVENILINPGGPGVSGVGYLASHGELLQDVIGDGFHLLAFDPRGVNSSRPRASCYENEDARWRFQPVQDVNSDADTGELFAWTENFVRACYDTMGEHAAYLNTPQTAADMNSILSAVGQENLLYWGFSYGTLLGQTYATLFPERSTRIIIDGVVNQFEWYGTKIKEEDFLDAGEVFDGFLQECWNEADACSLATLGSYEDITKKLLSLIADLRNEPISVYINNSYYGLLTHHDIWVNGIFRALYEPAGTWYELANSLAGLLKGNATEAFLVYHRDKPTAKITWDMVYFIELNDGLSGPRHWQESRKELVDLLDPYFKQRRFFETELRTYFAKRLWRIPKTHNYVPRRGVQTAHPLLVLSPTYDPACPLVSARSAIDAFIGSRLVEIKGYGHCSTSMTSLCVARHVRAFFYNGTLPEEGTQCDIDGLYFNKPTSDGHAPAFERSVTPEEVRINLAQRQLAQKSSLSASGYIL
ncbi:alpha/beta-hydrolase [Thozetella sp. PMI_491]|nr:alpha/beta-hydrolase [Thozetella sp. PMI_491]